MKPRANGMPRTQRTGNFQAEGPNWILITGGALLSTLSIRLGYKLKQVLDSKQQGNSKASGTSKSADYNLQCNLYPFTQDDHGCFSCTSGTEGLTDMKCAPNRQILSESDGALPLVTVPSPEFNRENSVMWTSSPDRLELPAKLLHHSNCSDSPCVSESGSDVFSKREVIQKLRLQLKRRDDMILEMQDQIVELQNSLDTQVAHSTHLQLQLDASNRNLFDSEREIQRLRKAIADHCVVHVNSNDKNSVGSVWSPEGRNGHTNGHLNGETNFISKGKGRDEGRIEMLRKEVGELKEVIEGKNFLLQNYKEQKAELSTKVKELQQRLDSQLPNIL